MTCKPSKKFSPKIRTTCPPTTQPSFGWICLIAGVGISDSKNKNKIQTIIIISSIKSIGFSFSQNLLRKDMSKNWPISESETDAPPSMGSIRRVRRPCFELLCTNIFSETANNGCSRLTVVDKTTWNRRISLGFPAFFKQFWLHLRKNFRKKLNRILKKKSFIINNKRRRKI